MSPPPLSDAAHKVDHAVARLKDLQLLLQLHDTAASAAIAKQHHPSSAATTFAEQQQSSNRRRIEPFQQDYLHQKAAHDRRLHQKKSQSNAMDRNFDVFVPQPPHHLLHSRLSASTSSPEEETDSSPLLPYSIASTSSSPAASSLQTSSANRRLPRRIAWPYQKGSLLKVHDDATSSSKELSKKMLSVQTRPGNPNKPWHLSSSAMSSERTATSSTSMTTTTSSSRSGDSDTVLESRRNAHLAGRNLSSSKPASIREKQKIKSSQVQRKREPIILHRDKSLLSSSSRRSSLPIPTARSSDSPALEAQKNRTPTKPSSSTALKPRRLSLTILPTARSFDSPALEAAQRKQKNQILSSSSIAAGGEFDKAENFSTDIENRAAKVKPRLWRPPSLQPEAEKDDEAMEERTEWSRRQPLLPLGCRSAAEDAITVGKATSYRDKENCCAVWPRMGGCIGLSRTNSVSSRDPPSLTSSAAGQYTKRRPNRSRPNPSPCYLQYNVDSPLQNPDLQKSKLYFV